MIYYLMVSAFESGFGGVAYGWRETVYFSGVVLPRFGAVIYLSEVCMVAVSFVGLSM